jgi:hypothetical protein
MTCPRCFSELEKSPAVCPECGINLHHSVSGIVKTSVVMISSRGEDSFYQSLQEVPEPLRRQLMETTTSENSGTIVIADRAGKHQLTQLLSRRETSPPHPAMPEPLESALPRLEPPVDSPAERNFTWIAWVGFLVVLIAAALISAFFGLRW